MNYEYLYERFWLLVRWRKANLISNVHACGVQWWGTAGAKNCGIGVWYHESFTAIN